MWAITKGYKQGRAVMFYDIKNLTDNSKIDMVPKEELVTLCEAGEVKDTKVQWWNGKSIIRSKLEFPLFKIDADNNIQEETYAATRCSNKENKEHTTVERLVDISSKAVKVGVIDVKKAYKNSFKYTGYDTKHLENVDNNISYDEYNTLYDLYIDMAKEFKLTNIDLYAKELGKKIKLDKKVSTMHKSELNNLCRNISTYLMNMAYNEINSIHIKYLGRH